jgi:hypothetical protein
MTVPAATHSGVYTSSGYIWLSDLGIDKNFQ